MLKWSNNAKKVFSKIATNYERAIHDVRKEIGKIAVDHFKKSFDREGFNNVPFMHWKLLKKERTGIYKRRKILHKTGTLKNSLRYRTRWGKNTYTFSVFSNVEYAAVHNEGLMSGRGAGFKMPKRQFMGYSKVLEKKIATRVDNRLRQAGR